MMTVIYCGRCGSTVGVQARFCRLCGGDILLHRGPSFPVAVGTGQLAPSRDRLPSSASGEPERRRGETETSEGSPTTSAPPRDRTTGVPRPTIAPSEGLAAGVERAADSRRQVSRRRTKIETRITSLIAPRKGRVHAASGQTETGGWRTPVEKDGRSGTSLPEPPGVAAAPSPVSSAGAAENGQRGPSRVLANVSGLQSVSRREHRLRVASILLALLVLTGSYLLYRNQLLGREWGGGERELLRAEDLSKNLVEEGQRFRQRGQLEEALTQFRQALDLMPGNQMILKLMGETYQESRQPEEALGSYLALLRIVPDDLGTRLKVAQLYQQADDWVAAQREYRLIIRRNQTSTEAAIALEAIETKEGPSGRRQRPRPDRSARAAGKLSLPQTDVTPDQPLSLSPAPVLPEATGLPGIMKTDQMIEQPDPSVLAQVRKDRGLRYLRIGEYRAAINELLHALRINSEDQELYYRIGTAYEGLDQPARAHDYFKRVDQGPYLSAAQTAARKTAKAAEESRRRLSRAARPSSE
jgi:tetratricopeptide (TPR) repeat protein